MPKNKFWKWSDAVETDGSKLILEGPISDITWFGDEVTPAEFRSELKEHSGDLTVVINSGGGDVFAGLSIYNSLREHDGKVTVQVDGLAASIASVIAMAGDEVIMSPGAMIMIHKPWTMVAGDVNELEKAQEILNGIEDSIIPIYQARTELSKEKIVEMLEAETWMTAEQAVELGFADKLIEAKKKTSFSDAIKNLTSQYAIQMSATENSIKEFLKLSEEGDDNVSEPDENTESVSEQATDVEVDNDQEVTGQAETETEVETQVETETETEEAVDPEVPQVNNSTKKEVKMTKTEEIAKDQVLEPKAQAQVDATPRVTVKDYLKTKESMEAFAQVLQDQAGKTSDDVRAAWRDHLETKLEVTNPEIFLPTALITEIEDAFKAGGEIWNRVTKTGADVWRSAWDTNTDVDEEKGRAAGYNRADEEEKREQELTFLDRVLRPQMVYKYITLNREDVKNQRSTGALVRFVLAELPRRIVREVERAIVIGDGRAPGSDYKINTGNPEGFYPIAADAAAGNFFASTYVPTVGENRYATLLKAKDALEADGAVYLIAKKGFLTDVLLEENANGGFLFAPGSNVGSLLGFAGVIEPDWMDSDDDNVAYLVVLSNYRVVGDTSIEAFTNFLLKTNKQEYLQEIWAGGGLTVRRSAVAISASTQSE